MYVYVQNEKEILEKIIIKDGTWSTVNDKNNLIYLFILSLLT